MSVITLEGIIKQGQILLTEKIQLPENTRVFVVVPEMSVVQNPPNRQLLLAAEALAPYYTTDEELIAFTALDGEDIYESR